MNATQQTQFNRMLEALRWISNGYQTPAQLRRSAGSIGLHPGEAVDMAYENIQATAKDAVKGVRVMKVNP